MKKAFSIILYVCIMCATATSCSDSDSSNSNTEITVAEYYCPMKCEGDKTYPEEGSCPVCGMDLVEK